jgi:hypothetical protein
MATPTPGEGEKMATEVRVSSPAATGGAGTVFEQHVNAYWLAQLLVGAIPPIQRDSTISEVYFEMEHLGWNTDDFLAARGDCARDIASRNR